MTTRLQETTRRERGVLVGLVVPRVGRSQVKEYLDELALLADTAGVDVQHRITQERNRIDAATFIGAGKAEEIGWIVDHEKIDVVIFDDDLSPVQVRNLEKVISCKILDRAGLILDIFASRAKSKESMTQVELAQLEYLLPRLTRQWTHLSKQYSGVGMKGPGEQQIETDRRAIRARITHLKEKLKDIAKEREEQRKGRRFFNRVALVGYTNAGKSTLMNLLSQSDVFVEDRLFATLDATARRVKLTDAQSIILTDTVGFIRKLPAHLIASFRSTLAEVTEADLLVHVVDLSHPAFEEHMHVVQSTLEELNAGDKPTIVVFNKIDRLIDRALLNELSRRYPQAIFISATRGINTNALFEAVKDRLSDDLQEEVLTIPQSQYGTIAKIHDIATVIGEMYEDNHVKIRFRVSKKNSERLLKLLGSAHSTNEAR
jgi:GTP-binding protein HflX